MKLQNHTLLYLSISLFAVLGLWAGVFYFNTLQEVKDSIDNGLENYKKLIIYRAQEDSSILQRDAFGDRNYIIREIPQSYAIQIRDYYRDTSLYTERLNRYESFRLLSTAFAARDGRYYELKIISALVNKGELIRKLLISLAGLYALMLASIILLNNFVLKRIWRPFYYLLNQLKQFKLGNTALFEPAKTTVTEFQVLNNTILSLLQSNLDTFTSQKQFIENAAHELQTPLAISINKLELLAESSALSEDDLQTVGNVIQTLESLKRLNRSLLLLSKIENRQFLTAETVSFNDLFKKVVADFRDLAQYRVVNITIIETSQFKCNMNIELAEILVVNLLKNAIVHSNPHGRVAITLSSSSFIIENTGESSALDPEKIFDRFYKKSLASSSTGLGLAIVKAIVNYHQFSIRYRYTGMHEIRLDASASKINNPID